MASKVDICNRGLQLLGIEPILSMDENTKTSRSVSLAYDICRKAELRAHAWNFAIRRAALAASATVPDWGRANAFPLPADLLRLLPTYPEDNFNDLDNQIENGAIYSDQAAPLHIRYIFDAQTTTDFDALFVEALAAKIAMTTCKQLTESNAGATIAQAHYKLQIGEARRINAYENISAQPPTDSWITVRN